MKEIFLKKYKPNFYSEFEIDPEYINLLKSLMKLDNLNILFIGDTGCGKTSLIQSTIKEYYINDKYYNGDILNINTLQEQGISYYRSDVKTFCQTSSSIKNKKKFLVLDDIDHINEQSQQVFRNCIDKYSHNVHFIASCTNANKVIESIQSRTILIKIKNISTPYIKNIINKIKTNENINISNEAIDFLILISNNSVRQIINYMEKFKLLNEDINLDIVKKVCTNISFYEFELFTNLWHKDNNIFESSNCLKKLYDKGYSVIDILDNYFNFIKINSKLSEKIKYEVVIIICNYIRIFHTVHEDDIELFFFVWDLSNIKKKIV
jgi:DNA polymerase III delta prime subunit